MSQIAIPYQLRARLSQLEPSLDLNWERELRTILAEVSPELKESIDFQILKPKKNSLGSGNGSIPLSGSTFSRTSQPKISQ